MNSAGVIPDRRPFQVVVSSLFYHKEELANEFVRTLMPQLVCAVRETGTRVRLVITLNYPFTLSVWQQVLAWTEAYRVHGVECGLIERGFNLGFGASHNQVFERYACDAFVVINNDLFCEREDWLATMVQRLGSAGEADLVGAEENRTTLRASDACGVPTLPSQSVDYLDGSLLGIRASTARRLGLFAKDFRFFYFEDADLFLRYRQAGAKIETIAVPHRHLRSASAYLVPRHVVRSILDLNRAAFFARWSAYMTRRKFSGRCHADLRALTSLECIEALPSILALTKDHPGAQIEIQLPQDAPTEFFWHPQWSLIPQPQPIVPSDYDRDWIANPVSPQEDLPPALVHLRRLGSGYPEAEVLSYFKLTTRRLAPAIPAEPSGKKRALFVTLPASPQFQGVVAVPAFFLPAAELLRARGYSVTWTSATPKPAPDGLGETLALGDWDGWLQALQGAALVVGPASAQLTLAQYLGQQAFMACGAILPDRAIWAWSTTGAFTVPDLSCLGCHHLWEKPARSFCLRGDERCLSPEAGGLFAAALLRFLDQDPSALPSAMAAAQRARLASYRPSAELDLRRWPDD
jgi:hypothetical protein